MAYGGWLQACDIFSENFSPIIFLVDDSCNYNFQLIQDPTKTQITFSWIKNVNFHLINLNILSFSTIP